MAWKPVEETAKKYGLSSVISQAYMRLYMDVHKGMIDNARLPLHNGEIRIDHLYKPVISKLYAKVDEKKLDSLCNTLVEPLRNPDTRHQYDSQMVVELDTGLKNPRTYKGYVTITDDAKYSLDFPLEKIIEGVSRGKKKIDNLKADLMIPEEDWIILEGMLPFLKKQGISAKITADKKCVKQICYCPKVFDRNGLTSRLQEYAKSGERVSLNINSYYDEYDKKGKLEKRKLAQSLQVGLRNNDIFVELSDFERNTPHYLEYMGFHEVIDSIYPFHFRSAMGSLYSKEGRFELDPETVIRYNESYITTAAKFMGRVEDALGAGIFAAGSSVAQGLRSARGGIGEYRHSRRMAACERDNERMKIKREQDEQIKATLREAKARFQEDVPSGCRTLTFVDPKCAIDYQKKKAGK